MQIAYICRKFINYKNLLKFICALCRVNKRTLSRTHIRLIAGAMYTYDHCYIFFSDGKSKS